MNEVTVNMDNLTTEEREQLLALVEKGNKKPFEVWKPQKGEHYFYVEVHGRIESCCCDNDEFDIGTFKQGRVFQTKTEAEFFSTKECILTQYKRLAAESWAGEVIDLDSQSQAKHYLYFGENKIYSCVDYHRKIQGAIYFKTFKDLEAAIETIGEENIIKYLF